ncbi:MAG: NAD-dependent epimerase/dehydratase family protein [Alphaproteobacteria bacterium]|nr:NAD-dependent epimerase/dehydratase family protein [Alphaproteobacteria bacterium]
MRFEIEYADFMSQAADTWQTLGRHLAETGGQRVVNRSEQMNMTLDSRVFVAGHRGMVGSALMRHLKATGHRHVFTCERAALDLRQAAKVRNYFEATCPEVVYLAAAKVGGIAANQQLPVDFIQDNLQIQCNVIDAAFAVGCKRLRSLGWQPEYDLASGLAHAWAMYLAGAARGVEA